MSEMTLLFRELRKISGKQRTLVNQLQLESQKLRQNVENKYSAMESAVQNRISEGCIRKDFAGGGGGAGKTDLIILT
jgi:t-SNARE complex subunit (syntaxin)